MKYVIFWEETMLYFARMDKDKALFVYELSDAQKYADKTDAIIDLISNELDDCEVMEIHG